MDTRNKVQTIREIQEYLRILYRDGDIGTSVIPDGVYDSQTRQAVMQFQALAGLPATGIVDYLTWIALEASASLSEEERRKSEPIYPFERQLDGGVLSENEVSDLVFIVQLMLNELVAYNLERLTLNGVFDSATRRAIEDFQRVNGLEPNGIIDKKTWNALAAAYNKYIADPY